MREQYLKRSKQYKNLFDTDTGFMRGRDEAGQLSKKFDSIAWGGDYCEGGPWQNSFAVYHDIDGLAELYGGKDGLIKKINQLFKEKPLFKIGTYPAEIHEMVEMAALYMGQCAISNQPGFHVPFIYAALGEYEKTEAVILKALEKFSHRDDGFPGDEDNGSMAGWYIFSVLGLFPFCPGKPEYILLKPYVKSAVIHLDSADIRLDGTKHSKTITLVLESGRPVVFPNGTGGVNSILFAGFGGEFGAKAICDVLLGSCCPSGRLPVSFPRTDGCIPCYYSMLPGGGDSYLEGSRKPLYPFGHGLSYTSFEYTGMDVTKLGKYEYAVTVSVRNTGNCSGSEVVQLYVNDVYSSVVTPPKELKDFARLELHPGEEGKVEFHLTDKAFWLLNTDYEFVVENGEFEILVGASSQDIRLQTSIIIDT